MHTIAIRLYYGTASNESNRRDSVDSGRVSPRIGAAARAGSSSAGAWHHRSRSVVIDVRGHEKAPAGGQVEVSGFGQVKVSTPCSSCRSGTVGPDGDGEGANQSPSPPGSSIEVCEGPNGHHFRLLRVRFLPGRCRAATSGYFNLAIDRAQTASRRSVQILAGRRTISITDLNVVSVAHRPCG